MVDRVRKGKINAEGGAGVRPRKFDFLATPDVSIRSFLFFFFFLFFFLFEPTGNNNGRKESEMLMER